MIKLINDDCISVMKQMYKRNITVDGVLTSPPYNTSRVGASDLYNSRYGEYKDNLPNSEYIKWQIDVFNNMSNILKKMVLYFLILIIVLKIQIQCGY